MPPRLPPYLLLLLGLWIGLGGLCAQSPGLELRKLGVEIAPAKTYVFIGTVSANFEPFQYAGGSYKAPYKIKVFPFFYSEKGLVTIEFSDLQLEQIAKLQPVTFKGTAQTSPKEIRRVEGLVTPGDATSGKIKVMVFVSKKIKLSFNTTYKFAPPSVKPAP